MSRARATLNERLRGFRAAVDDPVLAPTSATDPVAQRKASLFRNGLAVVGFTVLEDFVRQRAFEVADAVARSTVLFGQLPTRLQHMLTAGAARGLRFQLELCKRTGGSEVVLAQTQAARIGGTVAHPYNASEFYFGHEQSNIAWTDVEQLISAYQVDNVGNVLGSIASRVASGAFVPKAFFVQLAMSRHAAAHDAQATVQAFDLRNYPVQIANFAICFDAAISYCAHKILRADKQYLAGAQVVGSAIQLATIEEGADGKWRERAIGAKRARRVSGSLTAAMQAAVAKPRTDVIVIRDRSGTTLDWLTPA